MLPAHASADSCFATGRSRNRWRQVLLAALLGLSGCRTAAYRAANLPVQLQARTARHTNEINLAGMSSQGTGSSQIGPGDLVEITIASGNSQEESDPIQGRVSQDGKVMVPLMGEISVAGMEPFDAGERIAAVAVERGIYRQPSVVLKVTEQAVNHVTVLGAVKEPGVLALPRGSSDLLSAVAAAGGLTEDASTQVEVLRHNSPSFLAGSNEAEGKVALASYEKPTSATPPPGAESAREARNAPNSPPAAQMERIDLAAANPRHKTDYTLKDRDVVMVRPEEKRMIHVAGLVNTPNQFELPTNQDVHVLDAIAMAGGVKSPVADKVYVIRQMEGMSKPAVIEVSLSKAKKDGKENLLLASGDLVSVESTYLTSTVEAMSTFFRVGLSLGGNVLAF
jgi:polysaccharide biosynthesis/export protein